MSQQPNPQNTIDNIIKDILMLRNRADQMTMNLITSLITSHNQANTQYQVALKTIEELKKDPKKEDKKK